MNRRPRLERLLDGLGDRDLALAPALPADVEPVVAGVGARAAQVPRAQTAQLRRAQPAVTQDAEQRVVALAGDRAPVGDAQEVGVVGVGERLRRPGLVPGHAYAVDRLVQAELAGERADHRQIHAHGRRRRRAAAATTGRGRGAGHRRRSRRRRDRQPPAGGPARRPASPRRRGRSPRTAAAYSPTPPGRRSARPRRTGCAPASPGTAGGGEGERADADAAAAPRSSRARRRRARARASATRRERELPLAHRERLFPKPSMSGHVKPRLGLSDDTELTVGRHFVSTGFGCGGPADRVIRWTSAMPLPNGDARGLGVLLVDPLCQPLGWE